jgi:murein DD-endopeptidase MepM/ murein hydrolase activator NlpD
MPLEERSEGAGPTAVTAIDIGRSAQKSSDVKKDDLRRYDVTVGSDGVRAAFNAQHVPTSALDRVDAALTGRIDIYALTPGAIVVVWLDSRDDLVAVRVPRAHGALLAARYDGALAPAGFFDDRGFSLRGPLRARPVYLSHVTSRFGQRFDPITGVDDVHHGVDYAVPIGTEVFAAGVGRVKARGTSASAGNFIKLAHAGGYESWYLHLDSFAPGTDVGSVVGQNDVIARSGNTGRSTGPHLHYELRLAGIAVDPQRTMPIPDAALGPLALREHQAFIQHLKAMTAMEAKNDQ